MRACLTALAITSLSISASAKAAPEATEKPAERPLASVLSSIALPPEPTFPPGARPAVHGSTADRPAHIIGTIVMAGHAYVFGSGGYGRGSIPYGDFPVTPKDVGSWGSRHGAIGINHNDIPDPKFRSHREGIEIHAIGGRLRTEGCVGILAEQWGSFKRDLFGLLNTFGSAWLHIWPEGAAVTAYREAPPATALVALGGDGSEIATEGLRHGAHDRTRARRIFATRRTHHRYVAVHHHYWRHHRYASR